MVEPHIMPLTRKPLDRAEILDQLLTHGKWKGKELLAKLNEKLIELDKEDINSRTFKRDLNYLELDKGAPLHRPVKGDMFYYYSDKFSLKEVLLDGEELNLLKQAISILKKVDNFQMSEDLDLIIGKLENRIHTNVPDKQTIVQFEDHTQAKGNECFNDLFDAIRNETTLELTYHSYRYSTPKGYVVHPYLLKEYRNRWFLIGRDGSSRRILTLGLDRVKKITISKEQFIENNLFHPDSLFKQVIGVSIDYDKVPEDIMLKILPVSVQHVESKPIHKDQEIIKRYKDGSMIIKLRLMINYELKATILSLGEGIEILGPPWFRKEMNSCLLKILSMYKKNKSELSK
jgi:predicted DNA-binding transcriptional regulator YafY